MTRMASICALAAILCVLGTESARAGSGRGLERFPRADSAATDPHLVGTPGEIGVDRFIAVLFSAQDYQRGTGMPDLKTPNEDIRRVGEVLKEQYGFDVTLHPEATRDEILTTLEELTRTTREGDTVLIYYAGHGVARPDEDQGYWVPVDGDRRSSSNWVSNADVASKVRAMPARHVMVIADSCFAGVWARGEEGVQPPTEGPSQKEAIQLASLRSRVVLTSGGDEPVADGGADGMSVFGYFFVRALEQSEDRYVIPDRLFTAVRTAVVNNSNQTPVQGKLIKGMATDGLPVLLNQRACSNARGLLLGREVAVADEDWVTNVVAARRSGDDARYVAAVDAWISRWSDKTVDVCGELMPLAVPRMGDAVALRDALTGQDSGPRWRGWWTAAGGVAAASGVGLLASTNVWLSKHEQGVSFTDGQVQISGDPALVGHFKTQRTLNVLGGVLMASGGAVVGVGGLHLLFDGGKPSGVVVTARW